MPSDLSPIEIAQYAAACRAVALVEDGMRIGLGSGATAGWMMRALSERVRDEGLRLTCVPTSLQTAEMAAAFGLPLGTLDAARWLDLTIDGADEVDTKFSMIKGGCGALLREKVVATASNRMVVIADAAREVRHLGAHPLPIEVLPFGWQTTQVMVSELLSGLDVLGRDVTLRRTGQEPFVTDEGHFILDLHLGRIGNPRQLSLVLNQLPGVIENGLFIDICDVVIIGHGDGRVDVHDLNDGTTDSSMPDMIAPTNVFRDTD